MPSIKVHCAISKKRTGNYYSELHEFIDCKDKEGGKDVNHRAQNHFYATKLREKIHRDFGGEEAIQEWLYHIAIDSLYTYVKHLFLYSGDKEQRKEKRKNYLQFGFRGKKFIYNAENYIGWDEMKEIFSLAEEEPEEDFDDEPEF